MAPEPGVLQSLNPDSPQHPGSYPLDCTSRLRFVGSGRDAPSRDLRDAPELRSRRERPPRDMPLFDLGTTDDAAVPHRTVLGVAQGFETRQRPARPRHLRQSTSRSVGNAAVSRADPILLLPSRKPGVWSSCVARDDEQSRRQAPSCLGVVHRHGMGAPTPPAPHSHSRPPLSQSPGRSGPPARRGRCSLCLKATAAGTLAWPFPAPPVIVHLGSDFGGAPVNCSATNAQAVSSVRRARS